MLRSGMRLFIRGNFYFILGKNRIFLGETKYLGELFRGENYFFREGFISFHLFSYFIIETILANLW